MMGARQAWLGGILAGAVLGLSSLFLPGGGLPASDLAVARVNGHPIARHDLDLALEAMARDSRNPLPADAESHALSRLIDEELLFQRAIALDLPRNAATIRRSIVIAMIDSIIAQADEAPDEAALRALFEREQSRFAGEPRLRVRWLSAADENGAYTLPAAHPPDRLITVTDLRRYLGEDLVEHALTLDPGTAGQPLHVSGRWHVIEVLERQAAPGADFATHRAAVAALWRERAEEAALETYLARLRDEAEISIGRD